MYVLKTGFGIIEEDDTELHAVFRFADEPQVADKLKEGDRVRYHVVESKGSLQAKNIALADAPGMAGL
ncbi:cold shock domain-containing protein [Streptomyces sp. NBC_00536]|uniref:hypothetical protein n=1 Tax=Streptomyces sp. NBC_00536 TaxID=2975769 RepID=UPI002E824AB7|nr:hypothetical protein [Streptomyces sp. NBC_00536]WUC83415.1 cold shock domain-containing protein [Streptomyces sp. NBC_00536]